MGIVDYFSRPRGQAHGVDIDTPAQTPKIIEPTIISSPESSGAVTPAHLLPSPAGSEDPFILEKIPHQFGRLGSWRGSLILLVTSGSQFLDNVFMTSANIALSSIQKDFEVSGTDLQWMISAYTLSFGGFLLLAGALSDRYDLPLSIKSYPSSGFHTDCSQIRAKEDSLSGPCLAFCLDSGHWLRSIFHSTHSFPWNPRNRSCTYCTFSHRNHQLLFQRRGPDPCSVHLWRLWHPGILYRPHLRGLLDLLPGVEIYLLPDCDHYWPPRNPRLYRPSRRCTIEVQT